MTELVQVQFKNRNGDRFDGRAYTYIADTPLMVGDVVKVPTKYGDSDARVCRIDVPEDEVAAFRDRLLHITEPAEISGGTFDEFFT